MSRLFSPSLALARKLARAPSPEALLDALELALESAPNDAWIATSAPALTSDGPFLQAFPAPDVSLLAPPDADPAILSEISSSIFIERSLAQSCAFAPALIALGSDFGSDQGARARSAFASLASIALSDPSSREPFLREAFSSWIWDSLAFPAAEPPGFSDESGLEPLFWPIRSVLRLCGPLSEEIEYPFPGEPKLPLAQAIIGALGCPPDIEEALWTIDAVGGAEALAAAFGPLGHQRAALLAAETLCYPLLEELAPLLPEGDDLLVRQIWSLFFESAEAAYDLLLEPLPLPPADSGLSMADADEARRFAERDLLFAASRCSRALLASVGNPPSTPPLSPELQDAIFPSASTSSVIPFAPKPR